MSYIHRICFCAPIVAVSPSASLAMATCLDPLGDIDSSGETNVVDVQCAILLNLWSLAGQVDVVPSCYKAYGAPNVVGDLNCDYVVNVADTLLSIAYAVGSPLNSAIDTNGNQCPDGCESDYDSDGTFDFADCAPYDPTVSAGADESCNGYDDDCDGVVDEPAASTVALSCEDTNPCNGTEFCAGPPPSEPGIYITEVMVSPENANAVVWIELYNSGSESINIRNWSLKNESGSVTVIDPGGALFVPPHGFVLLVSATDFAQKPSSYQYGSFLLDDPTDVLAIVDPNQEIGDQFFYDSSAIVVPDASVARVSVATPSSEPGNWVQSTSLMPDGGFGTPYGPNLDVVGDNCVAGEPLVCDDGDVSTQDVCVPGVGCVYTQGDPAAYVLSPWGDVNVMSDGAQSGPEIVAVPPDRYVIAWRSAYNASGTYEPIPGSPDDSGAGVFMRILRDDGTWVTPTDVLVNQTTFKHQLAHRMAVSDSGRVAFVWLTEWQADMSGKCPGQSACYQLRISDAEGNWKCNEVDVGPTSNFASSWRPDVFAAADGTFGVVYGQYPSVGQPTLQVRFFDEDCKPMDDPKQLVPNAQLLVSPAGKPYPYPRAVATDSQSFIVVWNHDFPTGSGDNPLQPTLLAQMFTWVGNPIPLGAAGPVLSTLAGADYPEITLLTGGAVAVVRSTALVPSGPTVVGALLTPNLAAGTFELTDDVTITGSADIKEFYTPEVARLPTGGFMTTWRNGGLKISARGYGPAGNAPTDVFEIDAVSLPSELNNPAVAVLPSGCAGFVWDILNAGDKLTDIRFRCACPQ